jgi:hypothetical protein
MEPGEFGTRFGTGGARRAATGATQRDKLIQRYSDFRGLSLYSGGTGETHWDGGTLLRIRRLGVRIPPSALKVLVTGLRWQPHCQKRPDLQQFVTGAAASDSIEASVSLGSSCPSLSAVSRFVTSWPPAPSRPRDGREAYPPTGTYVSCFIWLSRPCPCTFRATHEWGSTSQWVGALWTPSSVVTPRYCIGCRDP